MAIDLGDYTAVLRREVTPPGSPLFASVPDAVFEGYLADAFWEARFDGFLQEWTANDAAVVSPVNPGGPDLPRDQIAIIVLYAGIKILRNQLINSTTRFSATAGPVKFETESSANLMTEMSRQLSAVKDRLLNTMIDDNTPSFLIDGYTMRDGGWYAGYVGDTLYAALGTGSVQTISLGEGV